MTLNLVRYIIREVFSSIRHNIMLSLGSVITVMVSLVILGASLLFLVNASNLAKTFEDQLEIAVFVKESIKPNEVQLLKANIEKSSGVAKVELTTKEQALNNFSKNLGSSSILSDLGDSNPFPDKLTVKVEDPQQVRQLAGDFAKLAGVDKVNYGQGVVDKLLQFTAWLRWAGVAVVLTFSGASLVLIYMNIKTNVFSRRREIQIMKLVGANNAFIRWPFFMEGLFLGLIGGLFAALTVGMGYQWLIQYIQETLVFIPIVGDWDIIREILGLLLLVGMALGAIGSLLSLRKFLKV